MENGFPATQVFERAGPSENFFPTRYYDSSSIFGSVADPMYHNSDDLSEREGYDFDQLFAIAKVQVSWVCLKITIPKLISSSLRPFFMLQNSNFRFIISRHVIAV